MIIIPAIDLIDGNCVRLTKGDFDTKKVYDKDPLEQAKEFESVNIKYLHIIDLDGAKQGKIINLLTIENIAKNTNLKIQVGGGIRTIEDGEKLFNAGVNKIIIGTLAVKEPVLFKQFIDTFGSEKIVLAVDIKDGKVGTHGWLEKSELTAEEFIEKMEELGVKYINCTDVSRDGTLEGPNMELYKDLQAKFPNINFVASGGMSKPSELKELQDMNMYGVIIGKAIYEGKITLEDLKPYL